VKCEKVQAEIDKLRRDLQTLSLEKQAVQATDRQLGKYFVALQLMASNEEQRMAFYTELQSKLGEMDSQVARNSEMRMRPSQKNVRMLQTDAGLESVAERTLRTALERESLHVLSALADTKSTASKDTAMLFQELADARPEAMDRVFALLDQEGLCFPEGLQGFMDVLDAHQRNLKEQISRSEAITTSAAGPIAAPEDPSRNGLIDGSVTTGADVYVSDDVDELLHEKRVDHFRQFVEAERARNARESSKSQRSADLAQNQLAAVLAELEKERSALERSRDVLRSTYDEIVATETHREVLLRRVDELTAKNAQLRTRLVPTVKDNFSYVVSTFSEHAMRKCTDRLGSKVGAVNRSVQALKDWSFGRLRELDVRARALQSDEMRIGADGSVPMAAMKRRVGLSPFVVDEALVDRLTTVRLDRDQASADVEEITSIMNLARVLERRTVDDCARELQGVRTTVSNACLPRLHDTLERLQHAEDEQLPMLREILTDRSTLPAQNCVPWKQVDGMDIPSWKKEIRSLQVQLNQ
jgi:hypothetical protein